MARFKPFLGGRYAKGPLAVCAALVALFLWNAAQFYLPGKGFTYLIMFGERQHASYLPELKAVNHYELEDSSGYDSQFYAQIAMHPKLGDPVLKKAVDSLPYRARRILFCWTAWAVAGGDPAGAMHVYAVQNLVCWVLLALVLLRWFPPTDWGNVFRWAGVLFSFGLCFSVRGSLVDGPSLLLIAVAMALAEAGWPWLSACVMGIAGLGKETNILAGAAVTPFPPKSTRDWARLAARAFMVVAPLAAWLLCLKAWLGSGGDAGARNFAAPFSAYVAKWIDALHQLSVEGSDSLAKWSIAMLVALIVQFLYLVLVPRPGNPWWRLGISYAVLMAFLGDAVWEGYPGAASRVLLPMALAFNVLVPRGRSWWIVLVLGNLTMLSSLDTLKPPGRESFTVEGPRDLRIAAADGRTVEASFDDEWYLPEKSRFEFWRWSRGPASLAVRNPHPFAIEGTLSFGLRANDERRVSVVIGSKTVWSGSLVKGIRVPVVLPHLRLEPGSTLITLTTDKPAAFPENGDNRKVAFSLRDLDIEVAGRPGTKP